MTLKISLRTLEILGGNNVNENRPVLDESLKAVNRLERLIIVIPAS